MRSCIKGAMIKNTLVRPETRLFDRSLVQKHRERALRGDWARHSFLFEEVADRLADRLLDVTQDYELALDIGSHDGALGRQIRARGLAKKLISCDMSAGMAARTSGDLAVVGDEEFLPFMEEAFDLIGSNLSLHWTNDLPGALIQLRRSLKPNGLFIGALFGLETLTELKSCLMEAELEVKGGMAPRVSPFTEVRDAGSLLQRAGFALPVTDVDVITLKYQNAFALMQELRGMGETNALVERHKGFTDRKIFMRAVEMYHEKFSDEDGLIPATFQIIYMTGWAPHESQQKPLMPGSGKTNLKDVL